MRLNRSSQVSQCVQILLKPSHLCSCLSQSALLKTPMQPTQSHRSHLSLLWALVAPARKKHYALPASFLPATVRKFTCYSHSPLLRLNGTKSGHCPPWLFSFGHQEFSDWLSSSLYITPVKPPLVELTSWKVNPVFHTLPKRHRPIMNILWHLPPFCSPIQNVPLWRPFPYSGFFLESVYSHLFASRKPEEKFCYGTNQEVASITIIRPSLPSLCHCRPLLTPFQR